MIVLLKVCRSIAIDHLTDQYEESATVIYIYFDYKAQTKQTEIYVVGTLLKQILCQIPDIPAEIESFYNQSIAESRTPSTNDLIRLLVSSSRSRIYVIFDALDECDDKYQQEMLSLLSILEKSGFKLLISMRPHMKIDQNLISVETIIIEANETDLENYVLAILQIKKNKNDELKRQCLELVKEAKGMYINPSHQNSG